jgi:MFS transporter, DHA2 family, multidrug resistance protein
LLDHIINEQAQIVAYANDYMLLIMATVPAWLLLLMMRRPRAAMHTTPR